MFLVKRVLWGNGASQVKPDQVENILTLKFDCHGHINLFYKARKKLEFNLILWASNSYLLLAWGHGHLFHVLRPIHIRANCLNLFCRHVLIFIKIYRIHTVCCQYFVLSIVCLYFYAFAGKVSERLLPELRSEGLWESLLRPMKIINKICFSAHLLKNYWKCKNNYLFFQLRTSFHPYKICDVMQTRFARKPSYHLIWERLQGRKDS